MLEPVVDGVVERQKRKPKVVVAIHEIFLFVLVGLLHLGVSLGFGRGHR